MFHDRAWIVGWRHLSVALGLGIDNLRRLNRNVIDLKLYRKGNRVAALKSDLPVFAQRIYFADNHLRPGTIVKMFNTVFGEGHASVGDLKRVDGRWVFK